MENEYVAANEPVWHRKFFSDVDIVPNMHMLLLFIVLKVMQLQIQNKPKAINMETILSENIISFNR